MDRVQLSTPRLELRAALPTEAALVVDYFARNRTHLSAWEPAPPPRFYEVPFWEQRLEQYGAEEAEGRNVRLHLFERRTGRVIGTVGVANIVRGAFHSAHLGFGLDERSQGSGLMREALEAVIEHAFGPMNLHRLEANHQPHNLKSAGLLRRLGFVPQGYARDYLFIAGEWRDHVQTALLNPHWVRPPE